MDYVSKWVDAQALPTNDARVVVKFLKGLFAIFGVPKALIITNRAIKRILERPVRYNPKDWSEKLNDALWAFRTAYKTPTGCTPFKMVYGKACHLPVEIEHKAYWALKQCNMDLMAAAKNRFMELNELMELRDGAYKNNRIYKEITKRCHDSRLRGDRNFMNGDKALLEEEKARRRGKVYNWKTATYGKIWYDEDIHDHISVETKFPAIVFNDALTSENEFPAIVYNDALTSKLDLLTEPTISPQHIDEYNLKDKTSLSECDEEEQNVLYFNDVFPFNVIYPDDSKSDKDNDDDKIDIK
ncbi:reverse transcriptase domain-containing protein [Tanacetum coccineum]